MKKKQHLYLVFGGNLKKIGKMIFWCQISRICRNLWVSRRSKKSWKSQSIKNIDFANKKFKLIPLFNVFDPAEKIIDYIHKLKLKKIKIDKLIFNPEEDLISAAKKYKMQMLAGVVIYNKKLLGIATERDIIKVLQWKKIIY